MCFHIYSPNRHLIIAQVSESISFEKDGSSTIISDILLENAAQELLNEVKIIYPNRFLLCEEDSHNVVALGDFSVLTDDIGAREKSQYNSQYTGLGYEINLTEDKINIDNKEYHFQSAAIIPPHLKNNPVFHEKKFIKEQMKGYLLPGTIEIDKKDTLSKEDYYYTQKILQKFPFTIFRIRFHKPLLGKKKTWIRLKFRPDSTSTTLYSFRHRFLLLLLNELYYGYNISGPNDIKHRLKKRIELSLQIAEEEKILAEKNGRVTKSMRKAINILQEIKTEYIEHLVVNNPRTTTDYQTWQIHLFPKKLRTLFQFVLQGDIKVQGVLPNIMLDEDGIRPKKPIYLHRTYDFISGSNPDEPDNHVKNFSLFFYGKNHSRLFEAAPFLFYLFIIIFCVSLFFVKTSYDLPGTSNFVIVIILAVLGWFGVFVVYLLKKIVDNLLMKFLTLVLARLKGFSLLRKTVIGFEKILNIKDD